MPDDRLKFRCYRCSQLIGVPPRRAGTVIACPKCKAELKVPEPQEQGAAAAGDGSASVNSAPQAGPRAVPAGSSASSAGGTAPLPSFMEEIAAAIPDDLASLRPEDIRVEAEFADLVISTAEPVAPAPSPPVRPEPETEPVSAGWAGELPRIGPGPVEAAREPSAPRIGRVEEPPLNLAISTDLPAINLEPSSILPPGRETRSISEVVLQPATVLAWSLLVLMALPMAFIAGLLLGHFVWR